MSTDRPPGLEFELADFIRALQERQRLDVDEVLAELTQNAVRLLPAVEHAGITESSKGRVTTRSATGPIPVQLDELQGLVGGGPCLHAARHEDVVRVDDVESEVRWPEYARAAMQSTPVRSVLSLALVSDSRAKTALNVYAEKPNAFDVGITEAAQMYTSYAGVAWTLARRDEQFHQALTSRDIIGQAKGMIMERFSIDAAQAFDLLKRLSQSSNTPVATVAAELVEAERRKES